MATALVSPSILPDRAAPGDDCTFVLLLDHHRDGLVCYLTRMLRDHAAAEDVAQEAFLRAYLHRGRYQPTAKFSTWLYRIATNLALNWLRDHRVERAHLPLFEATDGGRPLDVTDPSPGVDVTLADDQRRAWMRERIRAAMDQLPERQRAAVLMHRTQHLDYASIAEAMGCSVPTVKSLLWRAHETLRRRLAN
jgi:RNA polymerase sigma-70 factor (ECF subfamily)